MSAPLLSLRRLTMRFGGLVAVSEVDLDVRRGEILGVIGPNGAGKTTVFNAITGIYEPTEGVIEFDGRDLRRPFRVKLAAWWLVAGLMVGLAAAVFASNVDSMWTSAVRVNYRDHTHGFPLRKAVVDAWHHLSAHPRIVVRSGIFFVAGFDDKPLPGATANDIETAEKLRQSLIAAAAWGSEGALLRQTADGWAITDITGRDNLKTFPTREDAEALFSAARETEQRAVGARLSRWWTFILGSLLGAAGAVAVFMQTRRTPAGVAVRGIARTFQNIRLFGAMTAFENLLFAMDRHIGAGERAFQAGRLVKYALPGVLGMLALIVSCNTRAPSPPASGGASSVVAGIAWFALVLGLPAYAVWVARIKGFSTVDRRAEGKAREQVRELLAFVGLTERASVAAHNLAYGEQRRLEIARALATRPQLLLLDEPAAGMNPSETASLSQLIRAIRERGVTVLLIEHDMKLVMNLCDRVAVLEYGRKIADGAPDVVRADPRVIEAYLGREDES